jgi:hypothetical protein
MFFSTAAQVNDHLRHKKAGAHRAFLVSPPGRPRALASAICSPMYLLRLL